MLEDGASHRQWANARLWCLYRGTSVGPQVMQSALMALEAWLLQKGERGDSDLRSVFSRLLRESNNVAITAVLVSVALAYPYLLAETAVPLLTCRGFFDADLSRCVNDQAHHASILAEQWPQQDVEEKLLEGERLESTRKPHRRYNLENLTVTLQMTSARPLVWALFERFRAELPVEAEDDDHARVWRLRLHRMDVRNFVSAGKTPDGRVIYRPGEPSPELRAFRDRDLPAHEDREHRTRLFLWGVNVFEGRDLEKSRPEEWRERLAAVRVLPEEDDSEIPRMLRTSGTPQIAAVCLRDHWEEMTDEERAWCAATVCSEIEVLPELGPLATGMLGATEGVIPAALLVSVLLTRTPDLALRARAKRGLATVLLHPERHIAQSAANGIGAYLFAADRAFALAYAQALLDWACETAGFRAEQRQLPWDRRRREDDFDRELRARLCAGLEREKPLDETALFAADFLRSPGLVILLPLLGVFGRAPTDSLAQRFHTHLAKVLVTAWQSDRGYRRHARDEEQDDTVELRYVERHHLAQALARFALACTEATAHAIVSPLSAAAHEHPEETAQFVKDLAYMEDQHPSGGRFWELWQPFADAVLAHEAAAKAAADTHIAALIDALFLGISWKAEAREWKPLTGRGNHLLDFFRRLAPSATALLSFSVLVARFRGEFVPHALPAIAEKVAALADRTFLARATMLSLESIMEALVYSGVSDIRRNPELRTAAINLLDMLVDAGSSAAFKIRDDFRTPLRT